MDPASLRDLFLDHCQASKVLGRAEGYVNAKLCEVGKAYLQEKARALVRESNGRPVLFTYGSDGTPSLTRATFTSKGDPGKTVSRKAGLGTEFLVERAFFAQHLHHRPAPPDLLVQGPCGPDQRQYCLA